MPAYFSPSDSQTATPAGTRQMDNDGWSPAVTWEQTPATPADMSILRAAHDNHLRALSHDELTRLCEAELGLGEPTVHEFIANADPLFNRQYNADGTAVYDPAEKVRAMAYLRAQIEELKDRELFEALPKFSRGTGDGLDDGGSSGKIVGGGGVAGPSAADAVDMAKLLEECGALPASMSTSSPGDSTARDGA